MIAYHNPKVSATLGAFCPHCGFKTDVSVDIALKPRRVGDVTPNLIFDPCGIFPVCPSCLGDGVPVTMVVLDRDITDLVCDLNLIGHKTAFSCQGHISTDGDGNKSVSEWPYLMFDCPKDDESELSEDDKKLAEARLSVFNELKSKFPEISATGNGSWFGYVSDDVEDVKAPKVFLEFLTEFVDSLKNASERKPQV